MVPLDNFISRSPGLFLEFNFTPQIITMFQKTMEHSSEHACLIAACQLVEVLIQHFKLISFSLLFYFSFSLSPPFTPYFYLFLFLFYLFLYFIFIYLLSLLILLFIYLFFIILIIYIFIYYHL